MWQSQEKFAFVECEFHKTNPFECECECKFNQMSMIKKWRKVILKKSESKYLSALPKILNGLSLLTWRSTISSIIFGPFRLLGNAHLFTWLFRWPVGVDIWCRSCRPEVRIQRRICEKIRRISNLLKTFEVRTLSNSNANIPISDASKLLCSCRWVGSCNFSVLATNTILTVSYISVHHPV